MDWEFNPIPIPRHKKAGKLKRVGQRLWRRYYIAKVLLLLGWNGKEWRTSPSNDKLVLVV